MSLITCLECSGKGEVEKKYRYYNSLKKRSVKLKAIIQCPGCDGKGEVEGDPPKDTRAICPKCGGELDVGVSHVVWDYYYKKEIVVITTTVCPKCRGKGRLETINEN
jgi:DnaJ-class molecular chaperone